MLQLYFKPHFNWMSTDKVMGPQSWDFCNFRGPTCMNPNFGNFETPTWESQDKMSFGCWSRGQAHNIL